MTQEQALAKDVAPAKTGHGNGAGNSNSRAIISLSGIYEISKVLAEPSRLELTLANVINILSSFLKMRRGAIIVLDGEGLPEITATAGFTAAREGIPPIPQKVIDQIVATSMPLVIQDAAASGLFEAEANDGAPIAFIGVPVKVDHKVLGTLSIDRRRDGGTEFRYDEDMQFLTMVANLTGQTIRLHRILSEDRQRMIEQQRRLEKSLTNNQVPENAMRRTGTAARIVGDSPAVKRVLETIRIVARTNSTVLLRGESGTGKELFSQTIHELSPRKGKPFVKLNCAALPESVLESELFGHEKGSFTGAIGQRAGRFEMAHGGTLLLDEIGEISPAFQAKLLRVLQEGEFERVGGNKTIKVDVRLICATNKDLEEAVRKGEFRADLYYRINVVPIILPPLRERTGDISRLAENFLDRFNAENQTGLKFDRAALELISRCYFPGNVRELENCVQRTATLARGGQIVPADFACAHGQCLSSLLWKGPDTAATHHHDAIDALASGRVLPAGTPERGGSTVVPTNPHKACDPEDPDCPARGSKLTERERLIDAMNQSGWVQAKAARLLNLTPRQIGYALKRHNIPVQKF